MNKVNILIVCLLLLGLAVGCERRTPSQATAKPGTATLTPMPATSPKPTPNIGVQKAMLVLKAVGIGKQGSALLDANRLEEALKAYGEAVEALDAALAIDPTDRAVWCTKGTTLLLKSAVLYKLDQTDEGHKVLEEAKEALKKGSPCEEFGVVFPIPTP
ncbi:MAG: hypothetical protein A2Y60_02960 [Chloroflexi bacterium RBG_13_54_9]|nr:MAG: hypothetical protein A2Y60_02960 [Chloroflexi bacterium RBG_13_54_9]